MALHKIFKTLILSLSVLLVLLIGTLSYHIIALKESIADIAQPAKVFTPSQVIAPRQKLPICNVAISPEHDRFFYVIGQHQMQWLHLGSTFVVFQTPDHRYVVKLYQFGNQNFKKSSAFKKNSKQNSKKNSRKTRTKKSPKSLDTFTSFLDSTKACFEQLRDECGIVYVHLNKTHDRVKTLKVSDKLSRSHRLPGDHCYFIVQKTANGVFSTLSELMDRGDINQAKTRIDQLFQLAMDLPRKGFVDMEKEPIRNNNIGFSAQRAIYVDTTKIVAKPKMDVQYQIAYELNVRLKPVEDWLQISYPELATYYGNRRDEIMRQLDEEEKAGQASQKRPTDNSGA